MNGEFLIVGFATYLYHQITWQRQMTSLQILLQARFRIFLFVARTDFVEAGLLPVADPALLSQVLQPGLPLPGYWFLLLAC